MVNILFSKVLDENEKCVFYFYLKTENFLANQKSIYWWADFLETSFIN